MKKSLYGPYIIELLTPRKDQQDRHDELLDSFSERYTRVMKSPCAVSFPDNPMGQHRLSILECLEKRDLKVEPDRLIMNLNTFHSKKELDALLLRAAEKGIQHLLVVRGDGGPDLPRLDPKEIGGTHNIATSIDLLKYISATYPGTFRLGAAFNPYVRKDFELKKTKQKIDNGASFIITQPITGKDASVDDLLSLGVEIIVEAWMSTNIELLYKSVGKEVDEQMRTYDPFTCLKTLHLEYPNACVYLAMLGFKQQWETLLPGIRG